LQTWAWEEYQAQDERLESLVRGGDKDAAAHGEGRASGDAANAAFARSVWSIGTATALAALLAVSLSL
jgi:hypothetical protein